MPERVMNERYAEKQKAKGKSKEAKPDGGGNPSPKKRSSGGSSERVPKKVRSEMFCQRCKTHGGPHQTHNTSDCRKYDKTRMASPSVQPQESPPMQVSPTRNLGATSSWPI